MCGCEIIYPYRYRYGFNGTNPLPVFILGRNTVDAPPTIRVVSESDSSSNRGASDAAGLSAVRALIFFEKY